MPTSVAIGTLEAMEMLGARDPRAIVLPDRALTTTIDIDRPTVSDLKGMGLNLATLPNKLLYLLWDGVIGKLLACDHCAL